MSRNHSTARLARSLALIMAGAIAVSLVAPATPAAALSGADFYAELNLDDPALAAVAAEVAANDFAAADAELQEYYAARTAPVYFPQSGNAGNVTAAQSIADGYFAYEGYTTQHFWDSSNGVIDIDWDLDWTTVWATPGVEPPVNAPAQMYAFAFYGTLSSAYLSYSPSDPARDELAAAWMQTALDYIADKGTSTIGSAPNNRLNEAKRLVQWLAAFAAFKDNTSIAPADLVAYLDYTRAMAEELQTNVEQNKGNNWYISIARALYLAAIYLPEFADADVWRLKALGAADRYMDRNMRSDGLTTEPTINYQNYVMNLLSAIQRFGVLNGDTPFTDAELQFLVRQAEALAAVVMPDGTIPLWGDSSAAEIDLGGVADFADVLGRDDIEWAATGGATGTQPTWGSILFPESYAVMRTGWATSDQYLFIANQDTPYNASHRHPDDLSLVAYAYGRPLIVDPGVYSYASSGASDWMRLTTEAHNTVEVGGVPQPKSTQAIPTERETLRWYSNAGFDFYQGSHDDYQPVVHNRSVFSPKPGFWIVSDVLAGSTASTGYRQLWHFPADALLSVDGGEAATSGFGSVPGVVLIPLDPSVTDSVVNSDGYIANGYDSLESDVDFLEFNQTTAGTAVFDTVIVPGDAGTAPTVGATRISLGVGSDVATAMEIALPDASVGRYYLSHEASPAPRTFGVADTDARIAYIEATSTGDLTRWSIAEGSELVDDSTTLVSATGVVTDLSAVYSGTTLALSTGTPLVAGLEVYAPGATAVTLNGVAVSFTASGDSVVIAAPTLSEGSALLDEPFGTPRDGGARTWDFENGQAQWWAGTKGTWSVASTGSGYTFDQTTNTTLEGTAIVGSGVDDVVITTSVQRGTTDGGTYGYGLLARYVDADNHYKLRVYRTGGAVHAQIVKKVAGVSTVIADETLTGFAIGDAHVLTATTIGSELSLAADGTTLVSVTDSAIGSGAAGLYAHRTTAAFDDITVDASSAWNFEDGAEGWFGLVGAWEVSPVSGDEMLRQTNKNQSTSFAMVPYDAADVEVSVDVQRGSTGSSAYGMGVAARVHDNRTYYMGRVYTTSGGGPVAQLFMMLGGARTDLVADVPLSGFDMAAAHRLTLRVSGETIEFLVDGTVVATATDSEIPSGGVGLQSHNAVVSFDDITVTEQTDQATWVSSRGIHSDAADALSFRSSGVEDAQLRLADVQDWEDTVTRMTVTPSSWAAGGELGIVTRSTLATLGYRAVLIDTGSGQVARISRITSGSYATTEPTVLAEQAVSFSTTATLDLAVVTRGATIELWLDDVLLVSAHDSVIQRGGIAIIGSGVDAQVDGVSVTPLG